MVTVTKRQLQVMRVCRDEGFIEIRGPEHTRVNGIRITAATPWNLVKKGLMTIEAGATRIIEIYKLTPLGLKIINDKYGAVE